MTPNGLPMIVDSDVAARLAEMNDLLNKRIFTNRDHADELLGAGNVEGALKALFKLDLTPRKTNGTWAADTLLSFFDTEQPDEKGATFEEWIDAEPDLSQLKYAFVDSLDADRASLPANVQVVLGGDYPALTDYLLAYSFYVMGVREVGGLKNFVLNNGKGVDALIDYANVSAARVSIQRDQLIVPDLDNDNADFVAKVSDAKLSFADGPFNTELQAVVDSLVFDAPERKLIHDAERIIGEIKPEYIPTLVRCIKKSPVKITPANVTYFLPLFISQISGGVDLDEPTSAEANDSDQDFAVGSFDVDASREQLNTSAVKCAAQLYFAMTLGDELQVFDVANYFTHKYLIREGFEILDSRLRNDLQMYVFSNKFTVTDKTTGAKRTLERSRAAERQMWYRQVFNHGHGQVTDDVIVNDEFPRLWKVLMLESAKYIERARESYNDETLSAQGVQQAIEDLQYNLSQHCTGMANVATPLIYDELDFVIRRILMHDEVVRQVAPVGGTWLRAVEKLYTAMKGRRPRSNVINNKARQGYDIIRQIAGYDPATFVDAKLLKFVTAVDGFIISQSVLQDSLKEDLKRSPRGDDAHDGGHSDDDGKNSGKASSNIPGLAGIPGIPSIPPVPGIPAGVPGGSTNGNTPAMAGAPTSGSAGAPAHDEWDF